jgi:hypothetical protein
MPVRQLSTRIHSDFRHGGSCSAAVFFALTSVGSLHQRQLE